MHLHARAKSCSDSEVCPEYAARSEANFGIAALAQPPAGGLPVVLPTYFNRRRDNLFPARQKKERRVAVPWPPRNGRRGPIVIVQRRSKTRSPHALTHHSGGGSGCRADRARFFAGARAAESIRRESRADRRHARGLLSPPLLSPPLLPAWRLGAAPSARLRRSRLRLPRQHQRLRGRPRLRPMGILQRWAVTRDR